MVSGFFTSPCDHDRILSGDAIEMRIELKLRGFFGFSKRLKRSCIIGDGRWLSLPASPGGRRFLDGPDGQAGLWSSFTITLNDSGRPGSSTFSPLTIASYMRVRPATSSDLTGRIPCSVWGAP